MKKEISVQRRIQAESIPTRADKERYLYHLSAMTDEEKYELELKQKAAAQKAIESDLKRGIKQANVLTEDELNELEL